MKIIMRRTAEYAQILWDKSGKKEKDKIRMFIEEFNLGEKKTVNRFDKNSFYSIVNENKSNK